MKSMKVYQLGGAEMRGTVSITQGNATETQVLLLGAAGRFEPLLPILNIFSKFLLTQSVGLPRCGISPPKAFYDIINFN
jgi:hypothetical protein